MWLPSWLRSRKHLASRPTRPARSRSAPRTRLCLEPLEDRMLLSAGWAIAPGGTGTFDLDQHISQPDASGNHYVTGYFTGTVTFGSTTLTASNYTSYVAKVDPNGNFLWAEQFGGQRSGAWSGVTVDPSGNVYLTGDFNGTQSFGGFSLTGTSANGTGYLCKVDPNGNFLWAQEFAYGTSGSHSGLLTPIAVDGNGNAYVSWFANSPTSSVGFLSRFDPNTGNFVWTQQLDNSATAVSPDCVTLDASGNAYVGGSGTQGSSYGFLASYAPNGSKNWSEATASTIRADAIYQNSLYTGLASSTVDFQKFDLSGNVLLSEQITSPSGVTPFGMAVDASGNVYLSGQFSQSLDFDPGPGVAVLNPPSGSSYVVKLDSSGNFLSAWNVGGSSYGIALDSSGGIYTVGHFSGTTNFDTGSQIVSLTSSSSQGLYIARTTQDTGTIFGQVFNDLNNNGVLDAGESGIPNVTVYLDLNNSGSYVAGDPTATTDSQGYFHFADVAPGTYTLRQIVPSGYTATPASFSISVTAGLASETPGFADYTPSKTRTYSNTTAVSTNKHKPNAISSLTVSDSYTVLGISLALNVSNPNHNNLTVFLTGPNGTKVDLGSTTQTGTISFQVPYFDNTAVKGTWTLEVDGLSGGTLSSWSMNIDGTMS
jgi:hypothetical protein